VCAGHWPVCTGLAADLPELGTLSRQRIAALVGVAPSIVTVKPCGVPQPCGAVVPCPGYLVHEHAGRVPVQPVLKGFYERLRAAGKAAKVALTPACASVHDLERHGEHTPAGNSGGASA